MKCQLMFKMQTEDPSLEYIDHAFNRLLSFSYQASELLASNIRSMHRIRCGDWFSQADVWAVVDMLTLLADFAERKAKVAGNYPEDVAACILQAAKNARTSAEILWDWFQRDGKLGQGPETITLSGIRHECADHCGIEEHK